MNEIKQSSQKITKNGLVENTKSLLMTKFGLIHKRANSEKINDRNALLSKSSINNSKNEQFNPKMKLSLLGKNNKNINQIKKLSQSCYSLVNEALEIINKRKSRNNNHNISNITNDTTSKYYSSFFHNKPNFLKTMKNKYSYSHNLKNTKSSKMFKNITLKEKNLNNKSFLNKTNKYNDIVLNVKPIIKKKENIIHNQLWSKLFTSIDQKQNNKINKFKSQCLNKINININANININIKSNIINYNNSQNNNNNYSILTTNNENINNEHIKITNSKNYLPNISLNDITNFIPPEKDNSTISIDDEENNKLKKESKLYFNKIIEDKIKEKNKIGDIEQLNPEKIYRKEKSKNKNLIEKMPIKKENQLHKLYSSSMSEESNNDNINKYKKEIKYCESNSFIKISLNKSDKNNNNEENEGDDKNENIDINSHDKDLSFIGDNNSYHRVYKKVLDKDSSQKENINNDSDFTESNNRNLFNNNKLFKVYNAKRKNSTNKSDNFKIHRLLSRNYSFNVSSRDIYDHAAKKFEHDNPNINYHFISDIEKKNYNIINLSKKKFLNLNDICIFKILSFSIEAYLPLINSDKHIKIKINKSLNKIFENIINNFKFKYKDYLEIIHHKFEQNKIRHFYNNDYILDLILNCRIISKKIEESIEINCTYLSNNQKYDYLWKFDLQDKSKINKWISSEINTMKNNSKTISYTSQVSSFSFEDEIQIQINIFNTNNILEPNTLEWYDPIISSAKPEVYENTKFINKISFDPLRACEIEKQILSWHEKWSEENNIVCEEIKEIFKNFFKIKNIYFDKSKFCFYKFVMVPYKVGILQRNKYCNFDIHIIDFNIPAKNEIQCIYLINTNSYTHKMDIRIGSYLTIYIIDMQLN